MKLTILKGIPASGKSTYAKHLINKREKIVRVNMDSLRLMFKGVAYTQKIERIVKETERQALRVAIYSGFDIVIDDTNLSLKRLKQLLTWSTVKKKQHEPPTKVTIVTFNEAHTTCVKRDLQRQNPVGYGVIMQMKELYGKNINCVDEWCKANNYEHVIISKDGEEMC